LLQDSPQFLWITRGIPIWGARRRTQALRGAISGHLVSRT
jgi:hypothetical protein